jgi:hypothetical protein
MIDSSNVLRVFWAGLLIAAAVLVAGCGGSEDGATAAQPLTKAQFIKKASAICKSEESRKEHRLTGLVAPGVGIFGASEKELEKMVIKGVIPLYDELISELANLRPPVRDEAEVGKMIAKYKAILKTSEAQPHSLIHRDEFALANRLASRYGIEYCSL